MLSDAFKKFIDAFSSLPSIGPRQATRLAFYIKNLGGNAIAELAEAVRGLGKIQTCRRCFFSYENGQGDLCHICANPQRRQNVVAIIEKETDLMSLEKTKKFDGRYLIIGELKKDGLLETAQKLRLASLRKEAPFDEIILALNPTTYGDINADLISQEIKNLAEKITRLGRGIPTGGEIEFADEDTLSSALDNRS